MREGNINKLPEWAQEEIERLKRNEDYLKTRLAQVLDKSVESPMVCHVGLNDEFNLPHASTIRMTLERKHGTWIWLHENTLKIQTNSTMIIHPRAANSIHIKEEK
ncbi:MAG: hypothetical protein GY782_08630 [Gammaproteobacteria bacterium]|nr:hypothetical protein [Gammaproteobacteria bacterium]